MGETINTNLLHWRMKMVDWLFADHTAPNWVWLIVSLASIAVFLFGHWALSDAIKKVREAGAYYQSVIDMLATLPTPQDRETSGDD